MDAGMLIPVGANTFTCQPSGSIPRYTQSYFESRATLVGYDNS